MPAASAQHVSGLEVLIDGAPLGPEMASNLVEARVSDSLALPSSALVRITDPAMSLVDHALFRPGKEIEIKMGGADEPATKPVFKGEIVAYEPEFTEQGVVVAIRCYDKSHRLQRRQKMRTFTDVGVRDIVTKITQEAGLTGEINYSGSGRYKFFQQSGETDREVIAKLERDHDCRFYVRDGRYVFVDAAKVATKGVAVKYAESMLSFRPRLTTVQQETAAQVIGWDPAGKGVVNGNSESATVTSKAGLARTEFQDKFGSNTLLIPYRTVDDVAEAQAMAKSALNRRADSHFEAEARCTGLPDLRAGSEIKVSGVGTTFSGVYVASKVTHVYRGEKGYQTHVTISGRSERGLLDLVHPPQRREWSGNLVVGIVTNVNDPNNLGRVKVKYPSLPAQGSMLESTWARIATMAASKERGALMLPEVDDEVVVGFENGDTRRPLIVGAVFNGKDTPGDELLQANDGSFAVVSNKKAFMHSKEDMTFKSDKKMIIEVTSDREEKIDGKIGLKAGQSYEIEAGSNIKLKGVSISVEASGSLTLKGSTVSVEAQGSLDLKSSGVASLKGSMVNIG